MKTSATTSAIINTAGVSRFGNNSFLKNSANYLLVAAGEGIKQSLNGMDINVEFITLTARSLAQTSAMALKKFAERYRAASSKLAEGRYQYNNNTTLLPF